jgi:tripartite-type tricarboxylate transporter receptor subunit TctC
MLRPSILTAVIGALLMLTPVSGRADDYPNRPITIIVPYSAGGGSDVLNRVLADALDKQLHQRVIIENVTGAGGTTGVRRAAQSAPDGYTMVAVSPGTHSAAPSMYKDLGYDPIKSFEMVGMTGSTPIVLVTRKGIPAKTMPELIAYLKAHEKEVTLAHVGPGSMTHLACSMFDAIIGISPVAAAYRGTPPLMQDLLAGRVDYTCQQPNGVIGFLKDGSIRAFVIADDHRSFALPDVPDSDEIGMPGFKSTAWNGLVMPKGTPDAIVNKMNDAVGKALDDPDLVKRFEALGVSVVPKNQRSRAYQLKFMTDELERYTTLMHKIGIKPQ